MMSYIFLGGVVGGMTRGLVGFVKHRYAYKEVKFDLAKFISTVGISGMVGVISAFTVQELGFTFLGADALSFAMSIVIGYAGGDFLENLYKIILKTPSLTKAPKKPL